MTSTVPPPLKRAIRRDVLLPLTQFDRRSLKRRPPHVTSALADGYLDLVLAKACAGLRRDLRVGGANMRRAFMSGRFSGSAHGCWAWAYSGLKDHQIPELHAVCALTIYELARGMRTVFGECAGGLAGYLNQWARDPEMAMPTCEDLFVGCPIDAAPAAALSMRPRHPDRRDRPADGTCRPYSILRLGDLNYVLDTEQLNARQQSGPSSPKPGARTRRKMATPRHQPRQ